MRPAWYLATLVLVSCDARDFWRGKAPEEVKEVQVPMCMESKDCPSDMPVCVKGTQRCSPCTEAPTECAVRAMAKGDGLAVCIPTTKLCGQCNLSEDCKSETLSCQANVCTDACTKHSDCKSQVCDLYAKKGGQCIPTANVVYVDNAAGCMGRDGATPKTGVCTLAEGLAKVTPTRNVVRLVSSMISYGQVNRSAEPAVTIVGPAGEGGERAFLDAAAASDVVIVTNTGKVTIDGVEISKGRNSAVCTGGSAQLRLRRSVITGAADIGVSVTGCDVGMDRVQLSMHTTAALRMDNAKYAISNSLISSNTLSADGQAIAILGTSSGTFRYNTVVQNSSSGSGALRCVPAVNIEDSIVVQNSAPAGSQFSGNCQLLRTVVGPMDTYPSGDKVDPKLLNFRLTLESSCCLDKGQAAADLFMDFEGTPRPQGAGYDIGAFEFKKN